MLDVELPNVLVHTEQSSVDSVPPTPKQKYSSHSVFTMELKWTRCKPLC